MIDRLSRVFRATFSLDPDSDVAGLEYQGIPQWDSLAHMSLVADIEEEFGVLLSPDDVIELSSFARAIEILEAQGVSNS